MTFTKCILSLVIATAVGIQGNESRDTMFPNLLPRLLQTRADSDVQKKAAQSVIDSYVDGFVNVTEINPDIFTDDKDAFSLLAVKVEGQKYRIQIRASTGVAALWGFHYYMKKYCGSHISWQIHPKVDCKDPPFVNETVVANDRFRYFGNVCTQSYSTVWWKGDDWRRHIHWMALNGINMALAPLRQEIAWRNVYRDLGLTEDEIADHFAGPAFLAWQHMGNMRGWGGPLSESWFTAAAEVQDVIVNTMRSLGMIPVLPAFAGHVPKQITRIFPNATMVEIEPWMYFSSDYCCPLFVHPSDPLFKVIGEKFLAESIRLDGDYHVYSADPFNELSTKTWNDDFVKSVGDSIFSAMQTVDNNAVWLVQNWMFVNSPDLWPKERVKAFLESVPLGRLLVQDLQAERTPQYHIQDMYYGQPFIWCMLHNFGGTLGMFGDLRPINGEVYAARKFNGSTMIGVGLTMEGINQNYIVYDLMLETAWRKSPVEDLNAWAADYAGRRYGCSCNATARAWRLLLRSVYAYPGPSTQRQMGQYVVTVNPSLGITPWAWYSERDLIDAWKELLVASLNCSSDGFLYDLVDVTRQALQYRAEQIYVEIVDSLKSNQTYKARQMATSFIEVLEDMDDILSTNSNFMLSQWIKAARQYTNDADADLNEINARNQITLWGPNGEIEDYACKQWAGMMRYYYAARWKLFLTAAVNYAEMKSDKAWNELSVQQAVRENVTRSFALKIDDAREPKSSVETARRLLRKWAVVPGLRELPRVTRINITSTLFSDTLDIDVNDAVPTVVMMSTPH